MDRSKKLASVTKEFTDLVIDNAISKSAVPDKSSFQEIYFRQNKITGFEDEQDIQMVPWRKLNKNFVLTNDDTQNYKICKDYLNQNTYKLISYNVLAQTHLLNNQYLYKTNDPKHLQWPHRFKKLTKFFEKHQADIYCLQEVELAHLFQYEKYFIQNHKSFKTCFDLKPGNKPDGCLIAYNSEKFETLYGKKVDFSRNIPFRNSSYNIGQIIVFREKSTNSILIVTNTHLVYSPKDGHVKLFQICSLLREVERISKQISVNLEKGVSAVYGLYDSETDFVGTTADGRAGMTGTAGMAGTIIDLTVETDKRTETAKTTIDLTVETYKTTETAKTTEKPETTETTKTAKTAQTPANSNILTENNNLTSTSKNTINPSRCNSNVSTILCGDLNSTCKSGLWHFLSSNQIDISRCTGSGFSGQHVRRNDYLLSNTIKFPEEYPLYNEASPTIFNHNLNLKPCYSPEECNGAYTQTDANGLVVDHIFYNKIRPIERLALLPLSDFNPNELPGKKFGSDHMPVGICFEILEDGEIE